MSTVQRRATALVVVDMQNGFCHPAGSFAQAGADVAGMAAAIDGCIRLVDAARTADVPIYFTRAVHEPGLADWPLLAELPLYAPLAAIGSCEEGSWDAAFVDDLPVRPEDRIVTKSRFSPFVETSIAEDLRADGIEDLVVCGVGTSACVESTVRDASQRSFRTFVARQATGDLSETAKENSLSIMGNLFGYAVDVDEVVSAWS